MQGPRTHKLTVVILAHKTSRALVKVTRRHAASLADWLSRWSMTLVRHLRVRYIRLTWRPSLCLAIAVGENTAPFETYAKYVANNGKSIDWIITRITSNEDNDNQSILFTPVGHINKAQYAITSELGSKEEVKRLVIMTPYQAESAGAKALAAPKPVASAVAEEPEEVDEPKKRPSTKSVTEAPEPKKNLKSVVKAWSDEE
jgi:hypothetical protein